MLSFTTFTSLTAAVLMACALTSAHAGTVACPELRTAVQVGACPTEEQLQYTFVGYCSDDNKAYKGETELCANFQRYRAAKNTVLWESADGVFDGYISCDLPKADLQRLQPIGIAVGKQGKLTQLVCTYPNGVRLTHRTRAQCLLDGKPDCTTNPASCKAECN